MQTIVGEKRSLPAFAAIANFTGVGDVLVVGVTILVTRRSTSAAGPATASRFGVVGKASDVCHPHYKHTFAVLHEHGLRLVAVDLMYTTSAVHVFSGTNFSHF